MRTVIMTCPYSECGYKIESRTHLNDRYIANAETDVFGNPITDINCYTIKKNEDGTYNITVDKNKWMDKLANGI